MRALIGTISGIAITAVYIFFAAAVCAATDSDKRGDVPRFNSWMAQDTATGSWGGFRDSLKNSGVTVSSTYTADISGNPTGGLEHTAAYSGCLYMAASFDLEEIAFLRGLALKVSNYLFSGRNLSDSIGNFFWVQEVYARGSYFFGELDLSLSILDDMFIFEAGRIFAGDIFAVPTFARYYLTSGVDGRLGTIPSDVFFPHYNIAAWGVRATYQPNTDWYLITGLYNADPSVSKTTSYGTDFNFDMDKGYLAVGQLTYKHGHDRKSGALPGSVSFGSYYESSRFADLSGSSKSRHGNYGFYLMFDQMIYKGEWPDFDGPPHMRSEATLAEKQRKPSHQQTAIPMDRPKGLSVWGAAVLAPDEHINTQIYEIAAGALYQGLPPNRNRDVTAFCFILGHFSAELEGRSDEMILEFNHRFQLGPWFYITPDIQYVINPDGQSDIADALVLGFETSFNF